MNITKIVLLLLPLALTVKASDTVKTSYPIVKLQLERLPDLNTPRDGHAVFCVNGELTVAGGHTNGFVPTPTAEYFKDGKWRMMQMVYNHDFGFSVVMKNGKVLLGGGCAEPIGIGQTFLAELYDPITHTFNGFSSMAQKEHTPQVWSWIADGWSSRATGMPTMTLRCSTAGSSLTLSSPSPWGASFPFSSVRRRVTCSS